MLVHWDVLHAESTGRMVEPACIHSTVLAESWVALTVLHWRELLQHF
jgi:hypothetical protein